MEVGAAGRAALSTDPEGRPIRHWHSSVLAAHTPGFSAAVDEGTDEHERYEAAEERQRNRGNFNG
ncbi:hypothetical protein ACWDDN_32920 [Streptomyces griseoruber]